VTILVHFSGGDFLSYSSRDRLQLAITLRHPPKMTVSVQASLEVFNTVGGRTVMG
jgi:hypothetical protein